MGIGTSLGAYFETSLDHHAGNETPTEVGTVNPPLYLDDTKIPYEGDGTRHDRYREDEPGVLEWLNRDEKNAVKDKDAGMERKPEDILGLVPTHDNNVMTQDILYKTPGGLVHKASDIKTASPLVTITDADIDKGMGLGMSFSGGGLTTGKVLPMRKAANDNHVSKPGDEPFPWLYNPNEPNMIGSKEMDAGMEASWNRMVRGQQIVADRQTLINTQSERALNDIEKARLNKLDKEHAKHFGNYYPD